jgi:pre-mRNA-splicing factor CDC5/CEF1
LYIAPFSNNIFQLKEQLRSGLSSLPAPRNDYEIVVPDSEEETEVPIEAGNSVEDQADVDARYLAELKAKRKQRTPSHITGVLPSFLVNSFLIVQLMFPNLRSSPFKVQAHCIKNISER